jgi:aromatic ring-opening dioxygenase catalytic subunit (LigB family)
MLIARAWLAPHLPTLLVDQHRGHETAMLRAFADAAERLREESPAAIVIVSARWQSDGPFLVDSGRRHATITDYSGFGVEGRYDCTGHPALARALAEAGRKAGVRAASRPRGVDSGAAVPLSFLRPGRDLPVVPISVSARPRAECRAWGAALRDAIAAWPERVAFVVGGVLAHNAHAWALRRDVPEVATFDERALDALARGDWESLWDAPRSMVRRAQPETSLRHLAILRGFLGGDRHGKLLCYEPAPGTGAALVEFEVVAAEPVAPDPVAAGAERP